MKSPLYGCSLNAQVEKQTSRASKKLEKKKKKIAHKYKTMGRKERELTPGFLEDDEVTI